VTGWPTHVRGHRTLWSLLHKFEPNIFKYFKKNNYTVMWRGKNDMLAHDSWNTSVTTAKTLPGLQNGPNTFAQDDARYYSFLSDPTQGFVNQTGDYANVAAAIDFLRTHPHPEDEEDGADGADTAAEAPPFFIFLPLLKPHPPYSCPEPYYSMYEPSSLPPLRPVATAADNKPDYHALIRQYRNLTSLDDAFWRKLHAVYLGSISFSDYLFGLLLAAVDEYGWADSTTISVFADHGDYAGDYGLVEKWPSGLEDVLTRVPLIVRTPGGVKGHVVDTPVQLFDIVKTTLDIAGIPLEHVQFGVSQKDQILHGAAGDANRAVFAEGGYASNEPRDFEGAANNGGIPSKGNIYFPKLVQQQEKPLSVCRSVMVRTATHKLVVRTDPTDPDHDSELYDLVNDPREKINVYGVASFATVQAELKNRLFLWYMQTSDVTPWLEDDRHGGLPWPPKKKKNGGALLLPGDAYMDSRPRLEAFDYVAQV
jgi:choline-sulfatase